MLVNVEFFDAEPLENVITSLNYKVDKTIFFGYERVMRDKKEHIEKFLRKTAEVSCVDFCQISEEDLTKIMREMKERLQLELDQGNQLFFDLTGGESLVLVAFGALSRDFHASMHMYRVETNELFEYENDNAPLLSQSALCRRIRMNLDEFVSLYGGKINYAMHKETKDLSGEEAVEDIQNMWSLSRKFSGKWPYYSALLRSFKPDERNLFVRADKEDLYDQIKKTPQAGSIKGYYRFLDECAKFGFLKEYKRDDYGCSYEYKDETIQNYLWDSGSILELYTYIMMKKAYPNCDLRVGVHIDWDGVIHGGHGVDVLNEVDIMLIDQNCPVLVSCKNGNVNQMALYELETVAGRFGGKYAKKILIVTKKLSEGHFRRAKEMGIEIRRMG